MNYQKIYDALTSNKNRILTEGGYYEKHHIVPEFFFKIRRRKGTKGWLDGDSYATDNLVILPSREHYIAHWLLTKIYPDMWEIHFAFTQMAKCNNKNERVISSRQFERAKQHYKIGANLRKLDPDYINPGKGTKSRETARNRMLSDENPMKKNPEKNPFLGKSYVAGRRWFNNRIENKYLYINEPIPEGFVLGMAPYSRTRNGKESNHKG